MVRCRWCLDITSGGDPDDFHIKSEKECPYRGKGEPYFNLEMITHIDKEHTELYRNLVNYQIEELYPEYYKELKEKNEL